MAGSSSVCAAPVPSTALTSAPSAALIRLGASRRAERRCKVVAGRTGDQGEINGREPTAEKTIAPEQQRGPPQPTDGALAHVPNQPLGPLPHPAIELRREHADEQGDDAVVGLGRGHQVCVAQQPRQAAHQQPDVHAAKQVRALQRQQQQASAAASAKQIDGQEAGLMLW